MGLLCSYCGYAVNVQCSCSGFTVGLLCGCCVATVFILRVTFISALCACISGYARTITSPGGG